MINCQKDNGGKKKNHFWVYTTYPWLLELGVSSQAMPKHTPNLPSAIKCSGGVAITPLATAELLQRLLSNRSLHRSGTPIRHATLDSGTAKDGAHGQSCQDEPASWGLPAQGPP